MLVIDGIDSNWSAIAKQTAVYAHAGQTDKSGYPYIFHVERVAANVALCGDYVEAAAWLHDTVEDTHVTMDNIRAMFPQEIADAVDALTHRPNEPLESYWTRVANNRIAFIVKLHGDMPDNNSPARHAMLDDETSERIRRKYVRAINFFANLCQPDKPTAGYWEHR